jgi:uncharacterized protein
MHGLMRTLAATTLVALIGCASSSAPVQLYQLRAEAPAPAASTSMSNIAIWQLASPVRVPDYLDRDAFLVPQGQAGLQALAGQRWAEPLRESVPRLLRADLGQLLGDNKVWTSPLPPGLVVNKLLRARWSISNADGATHADNPQVQTTTLTVPSSSSDVDALVAAHRLALWRLAERIAGTPANMGTNTTIK